MFEVDVAGCVFELVYNTGCVIFEGVEGDSLQADGD